MVYNLACNDLGGGGEVKIIESYKIKIIIKETVI